jgi:hypothetical protein
LLFVLGAWIAVGGAQSIQSIVRSRTVFCLAVEDIVSALVVTLAAKAEAQRTSWHFAFVPSPEANRLTPRL